MAKTFNANKGNDAETAEEKKLREAEEKRVAEEKAAKKEAKKLAKAEEKKRKKELEKVHDVPPNASLTACNAFQMNGGLNPEKFNADGTPKKKGE